MLPDVLVYDDPSFENHVVPEGHPESPRRLLAARDGIALFECMGTANVVRRAAPATGTNSLLRVHSQGHVERLLGMDGETHNLDGETHVSPGSVAAALRAAGGAEALALSLLAGEARFGVSIGRPPGHHATRESAMGFCLLNNVAVAAAAARVSGAERVLVLDWDAHHGNGTQDIFYSDPSVLYVSLHNERAWPFTGKPDQVGAGDGVGMNVNISIPAGSGDDTFEEAFRRLVSPVVRQFDPSIVLVSAGFDADRGDPVGGFALSPGAFRRMAFSLLLSVSDKCPVGLVLEGGYDLAGLAASLHHALRGLASGTERVAPSSLAPAAEEALARVEKSVSPWWALELD